LAKYTDGKTKSTNTSNEQMLFAERYCAENGLQFTPSRRKVLDFLLQSGRALGAYDLLDRLHKVGFKPQPPVVYRALDFLVKYGFVHKVEHLNAFIACIHPGKEHSPAFMICRSCDSVSEMDALRPNFFLTENFYSQGFKVEESVIEARGLCGTCADVEVK